MLQVELKDGSKVEVQKGASVLEIAVLQLGSSKSQNVSSEA